MNILIIGNGAREQAIVNALSKHSTHDLYNIATQCNPGIHKKAKEIVIIPFDQTEAIIKYTQQKQIDFAIIGPEKPLELGLADQFWQAGIPVIGPTQRLAQIETSKGFARDLMAKYKITGLPYYRRFTHYSSEVDSCLQTLGDNYVIKEDGLMSGKGVKVAGDHLHTHAEAIELCKTLTGSFVIEKKLVGPEFSLINMCDGTTLIPMPLVQDHKRLFVDDKGPNTGGMGCYSLADHRLPFLTEADIKSAQQINEAVMDALKKETNERYCGFLYGGFMKTVDGIQVIEFNARLGDPEAINLMALLETDFVELCQAMLQGNLARLKVKFSNVASVCKYIVPHGYPDRVHESGLLQTPEANDFDSMYYASVVEEEKKLKMLGSRAIAFLATDPSLNRAEQKVEQAISKVQGEFHWRKDIAKNVLVESPRVRIAVLGSTRGSNLIPLIQHIKNQQLLADVIVVASDQENAGILDKARQTGVTTLYVPFSQDMTKDNYGTVLAQKLQEYHIDVIVLLGFMRLLPETFIEKWPKTIINVHPSLLPRHAGKMDLAVHTAVLDAQDTQTGCTVHRVNGILDGGPILVQKTCTVELTDTPLDLKEKVQALEPLALTQAIQILFTEHSSIGVL